MNLSSGYDILKSFEVRIVFNNIANLFRKTRYSVKNFNLQIAF